MNSQKQVLCQTTNHKNKMIVDEEAPVSIGAAQNIMIIRVNPNGAEGHNVPTLFSEGYFSKQKGVWRSEIS